MRRFVAVRIAHAVVVVFIVTTIAFFLIHSVPGDPFQTDNPRITQEIRDRLRAEFGYDRPVIEQYVRYVGNVARGELGFSHSLQIPVLTALGGALKRTLALMASALTLSFALGIWLGVFEARHAGRRSARVANRMSLLLYSMPDFWVALMLLLAFAYWIPLFPAGGMIDVVMHDYLSPMGKLWDYARHMALPLLALTLVLTAYIARYQRAVLLDQMPSDYVRTARAKGADESRVVRRHALRNALLPMITLAGLAFPMLLGGAVFVEKVFAWPGMGLMITTAIFARDYPLVIAGVIVGGVMVTLGSLLADIAYGLADPRIRVR
ncbi:MAG: ABC transporter permease [Gemmatimonadaceae bacterium]